LALSPALPDKINLLALDAKTGAVLWGAEVADDRTGQTVTVAPQPIKDLTICGVSG